MRGATPSLQEPESLDEIINNIDPTLKEFLKSMSKDTTETIGCDSVSISVYDSVTKTYAGVNDTIPCVGGSEKKISIMYVIFKLSTEGHLDLSDVVKGQDRFKARRLSDLGNDEFTYLELVRGALSNISRSNTNYFSNLILDAVSMERINQEIAGMGFNSTQFNGFYLPVEISPGANYHHNQTTMKDMVLMMYSLSEGIHLDSYHTELAHQILSLHSKPNVLGTKKPNEHQIYKLGQTESDMGLVGRVFGNKLDYFVSISLNGAKSLLYDENFFSTDLFISQNKQLLGALSKIYQHFRYGLDKTRTHVPS